MTLYPKYNSDPEFEYDDFERFISSVVEEYNEEAEEEFWASTYHDFSFDYGKKGYENLKTRAAQQIIEETGISDPVIATNTGDKPTDVLEMENSIFFAQQGTEAEEYCERNDIPYVTVENAAESFAIQAQLARKDPLDV